MGLDGISVNQLRIVPDNNSNEMNNQVRFNLNQDVKVVDGLSQGQRVDPDKEREQSNAHLGRKFDLKEGEEDEDNQEQLEDEEVIKYDLSKNDKYFLKVDDNTNSIMIVEKESKKVVEKISSEELSVLVNYLANSQGSIINKRY